MGPWAAPGPGRGRSAAPGLQLTVARGPAAGRGRSHGPRANDKPGARTDQAASRTGKPASRTGQPAPGTGQPAPGAGQPAPGTGQPASRTGQPASRTGQRTDRTGTPRGPRAGQRAGGRGGGGGASRRLIDPARLVAFEVLRAVRERDAYANLVLPALLRDRGLAGRDAAFATALGYGTLRGQGTYDAVIAACSSRGLDQIDPPVLDVLRLGAHQLLATRVGAHAAVATSVDLAREVSGPGAAGFVNAVLRRMAGRDLEAWIAATAPSRSDDPLGHLAVRYSCPAWIVAAFAASLGEDPAAGLTGTEAALAACSVRPQVALCAVPGLASQAELVAAGAEPAHWSPFGAYLERGDPTSV